MIGVRGEPIVIRDGRRDVACEAREAALHAAWDSVVEVLRALPFPLSLARGRLERELRPKFRELLATPGPYERRSE